MNLFIHLCILLCLSEHSLASFMDIAWLTLENPRGMLECVLIMRAFQELFD